MKPLLHLPDRPKQAARDAARAFLAAPGGDFIAIYDDIGPAGISAKMVLDQLQAVTGNVIDIRLNSGGGDIYDGIAIYNDICRAAEAKSARVIVTITGLAASAASVICMAADEIAVAPGARMMLHNSWCWGEGNADYFASLIQELRAIDASMAAFYAARSGKTVAEVAAMMNAETYLDAAQAVELGFADRLEGAIKTKPGLDPTAALAGKPKAKLSVKRPASRAPLIDEEEVALLEKLALTKERASHAR